jgi:hypothetical protein
MMTPEEIAGLFYRYRRDGQDRKARMQEIAQIADGDIAIPLPELNAAERPAVVNLTHQGIQGMAQRFSTVQPNTDFIPYRNTKAERKAAEIRTRLVDFWWAEDRAPLVDAQAGRYMFGYGTAPMRVDWHLADERPMVSLPSPLAVYAPRPVQVNDIHPAHGIAARRMDVPAVRARWGENPAVARQLADASESETRWVLEYADADEVHLVLCGDTEWAYNDAVSAIMSASVTLAAYPNRAGVSPWIVPGLVHLNRPQGHFDQIIGMYQAQGLLTALELQQAARSVFQETWVVARANEMPEIVTPADPMTGQVGVIQGGDIRTIAPDPQFHTHATQDRLAEAQRATAGIPADFGGQAASNVRTGRRAAQLIQSTVDPALAEAQTMWATAKELQIAVSAEYDKAYSPDGPKTFVINWRGKHSENTYVPKDLWEKGARCVVEYPVTGVDANGLMVLLGQARGMNLISERTARKMSPLVRDAEGEGDEIMGEQLSAAFAEMIAQLVASPDSPLQPRQVASLIRKVRDQDVDLVDAFMEVQEEMQAEQAEAVPAGPAAMPGADGAGAIPPPIEGPQEGTAELGVAVGVVAYAEHAGVDTWWE